jgi:hypothetical protein
MHDLSSSTEQDFDRKSCPLEQLLTLMARSIAKTWKARMNQIQASKNQPSSQSIDAKSRQFQTSANSTD